MRCDPAITGLVVLAFLGQNHVPGGDTEFALTVERAITWLVRHQASNGLLSGQDGRYTMYTHGIATLALSEAYLMTRNSRYIAPLRRAVDVILRAQHPETGGWRYLPTPPIRGDTSITGWQVMALKSAAAGGIEVPERVFDLARHWFDEEVGGTGQGSQGTGGIYGYSSKTEPRVAMVAEGLFARQVLGAGRGHVAIEQAARYLNTETRGGKNLQNLYLVYYGTMALYQYQGWIWEDWNGQVRDYLVRSQRRDGSLAGSWDPTGPWSEVGGRFLATAFAALSLEVYYRYLPLYWTPAADDAR